MASAAVAELSGTPVTSGTAGRKLVAAGGAGLLLSLAFPPFYLPVLAPVALALFLLQLQHMPVRWGFYTGFVFGMVFFDAGLWWLTAIFSSGAAGLWAICAFFTGLFAALYVWIIDSISARSAWLVTAVLWTGIEMFRSEWMVPSFGFLGLGYSLIDSPISIMASWWGSYGLTFLVVCLAAGTAQMLKADRSRLARRDFLAAAVVASGWIFAVYGPVRNVKPERSIKVTLVQTAGEDEEYLYGQTSHLAHTGTDVVIWPEYSFSRAPTLQYPLWNKITQTARTAGSYLLFGGERLAPNDPQDRYYNTAFLLDRSGRLIGEHVKNHPLPFFKDGIAGRDAHVFALDFGRVGVATCFDLDFPDVARRLTQNGAEVLLAPSNNPGVWGPRQREEHRQMFRMRAVECGRWLAVADVAGTTLIADSMGRLVAAARDGRPQTVSAAVGLTSHQTIYVRGGWLFGPLCFWMTILIVVLRSFRRYPALISRR
jgi:apolipoprotein N-acyltransferase